VHRASAALLALLLLAAPARAADPAPSPVPAPAISTLATDDRRDLLIEGLAFHRGEAFVSAVAGRTILRVRDGGLVPFLKSDGQTGALFGLAVDAPRGVLWAAEAWGKNLPNGAGASRTGLLKVSLADGRILGRYPAPQAGQFGDVVVDPAGAVYASDGATGAIWVLRSEERRVGKECKKKKKKKH